MTEPVIDIDDISFAYRLGEQSVPVLRGVSLRVEPGEMVAIQGPSGSGKSTLLHIVGGLLKPDSGRYFLGGKPMHAVDPNEMAAIRNADIGFVFQQFHLVPRTDIVDNILLPTLYSANNADGQRRGELRRKAIALAEKVGLGQHLNHLPNQLSGGQQQRVAIARALINDAPLILADEPTGNLDSKSAAEIMALFKELNSQGKTIVIITHDHEIAEQCGRTIFIRDGEIQDASGRRVAPAGSRKASPPLRLNVREAPMNFMRLVGLAIANLRRNKIRSILTMLGVTIGIASVLSMVTLGEYAKRNILKTYEVLGVNRIMLTGWPNMRLKATDPISIVFREFDWDKDLKPLTRIFPDVALISPVTNMWGAGAQYGGRKMDEVTPLGVNAEYFTIANRNVAEGHPFSTMHVEQQSPVCVIGHQVAVDLFQGRSALKKIITIASGESSLHCRVIGVLESQPSNRDWTQPDKQILIPVTFFQGAVSNEWFRGIHQVAISARKGADVEQLTPQIEAFFKQKYGRSGEFYANADAVMLAQVRKFLAVFSFLLAAIAMISLLVGGIGITNMMLVAVAERFREIGLRKALGATDRAIRTQFLLESVWLCLLAGAVGLAIGFATYQGAIWAAAKFMEQFTFEWVVEPWAVLTSVIAIVAVGIGSGLIPAIKAERLQVIEALRSE